MDSEGLFRESPKVELERPGIIGQIGKCTILFVDGPLFLYTQK